MARAEAKADVGDNVGTDVAEVLANIDAMELAVEETASAANITTAGLTDIHRALMKHSPNDATAGQVRTVQNWIGGNDYKPCGGNFVPPPPEHVERLLGDLCDFANSDQLPPLIQSAIAHAQFRSRPWPIPGAAPAVWIGG